MRKPAHSRALDILRARQQKAVPSEVTLCGGQVVVVHNFAWGYDMGDPVAHVTTNISPAVDGAERIYFFADQVVRIVDPENGATWFESQA